MLYVLMIISNEEVVGSETREVYAFDMNDSISPDTDWIQDYLDELINDKNASEGIEVGEADESGVEIVGYTGYYEILEGMNRAEIEEEYGDIIEV